MLELGDRPAQDGGGFGGSAELEQRAAFTRLRVRPLPAAADGGSHGLSARDGHLELGLVGTILVGRHRREQEGGRSGGEDR